MARLYQNRFEILRRLLMAATVGNCIIPASFAQAQTFSREGGLEQFAREALSTFGLVAIPNESASALSVKNTGVNGNSFRSLQFGGGKRMWEDRPIWLEGYVGYQRYDPQFILTNGNQDLAVRAKWTGVAATGGIGWDYRLAKNWALRPILNLSVGRILSDADISGTGPGSPGGPNLEFLGSGGLTVFGIGGSVLLDYEERTRARDVDFKLRYTQMRLMTVGGSSGIDATSDVATVAAWVRARYPIPGLTAFHKPVKSVWEASFSAYPGDQGKLLGIDWLGGLGVGLELDTSGTGVPFVSRARLLARYVFGDDYQGYSLGIGFSF